MYLILSDGKELRFILKENWVFSVFSKYSVLQNFLILLELTSKNISFKNKFDNSNLEEFTRYLKLH
jgi:hypothetical protein